MLHLFVRRNITNILLTLPNSKKADPVGDWLASLTFFWFMPPCAFTQLSLLPERRGQQQDPGYAIQYLRQAQCSSAQRQHPPEELRCT